MSTPEQSPESEPKPLTGDDLDLICLALGAWAGMHVERDRDTPLTAGAGKRALERSFEVVQKIARLRPALNHP
jgi:hypothetical protein